MSVVADWGARLLAGAFQLFPAPPRELTLRGAEIEPVSIDVPTRHGHILCLVYRPAAAEIVELSAAPVYLNFHGGAFIVRSPRQDDHACRFIAEATGAVVISVDYDTAPQVRYPVAEEQAYDVFVWVRNSGISQRWSSTRIAVGGFSAGGKLAINVCQQARDAGTPMPVALVACYPALNMTLAPTSRKPAYAPARPGQTSAPVVAPWLIRLMYGTYFADVEHRGDPLASPELDSHLERLPPTLVVTGARDSVGPEGERFARALETTGVSVCLKRFEDSDHGMTHNLPLDVARDALELIAAHVGKSFE